MPIEPTFCRHSTAQVLIPKDCQRIANPPEAKMDIDPHFNQNLRAISMVSGKGSIPLIRRINQAEHSIPTQKQTRPGLHSRAGGFRDED
jgi:hypothetical protein